MSAYEARPVRRRRTAAELADVDAAIISAVEDDKPVTLRGVFYRVVSAGAAEKTEAAYALIGRELLKLRRAGRVDYADITDGTRWIAKPVTWSDVDEMLADAAVSYRRALWRDQAVDVHVFTEKDAITGVISPVTEEWDVPLGVLRGYASESFAWSVAQAIATSGRETYVYQLGDHDPSGVDAWRAFAAKVSAFVADSGGCPGLYFERIAVTPEQIEEMVLPTRPTKQSDTRAARFSGESVEVDAIPAGELRTIVDDAIRRHIDEYALMMTEHAERSEREIFTRMRQPGPEAGEW